MKLLCDCCGRIENVILLPDNLMQFECGEVSETTIEDMHKLVNQIRGEE
jgi:hypothetical protein